MFQALSYPVWLTEIFVSQSHANETMEKFENKNFHAENRDEVSFPLLLVESSARFSGRRDQ